MCNLRVALWLISWVVAASAIVPVTYECSQIAAALPWWTMFMKPSLASLEPCVSFCYKEYSWLFEGHYIGKYQLVAGCIDDQLGLRYSTYEIARYRA